MNIITTGIFWAIPDKITGQSVLEVHKSFYINEADGNGFINYPYSHYEVWDDEVRGLGDDCYRYPRGRVIFNVNSNKHLIYADKCISWSCSKLKNTNCAATNTTFVVTVKKGDKK